MTPVLSSVHSLQRHLQDFGDALQHSLDRLAANRPYQVMAGRVDPSIPIQLAPHLFEHQGRRYIGAYVHGIDCPTVHAATIADAVELFETVCLDGVNQMAVTGGVSAGKSSVLHCFRLLLGALCALSNTRFAPVLVQSKLRAAAETANDIMSAFHELYGGIAIVCGNGRRIVLGQYLNNLHARLGGSVVQPVNDLDYLAQVDHRLGQARLTPIGLVDDADTLPRFLMNDDYRKRFGPSIEALEQRLPKLLAVTARPELYPHTRVVKRDAGYQATHQYYRGDVWSDGRVTMRGASSFEAETGIPVGNLITQHPSQQALATMRSLEWCNQHGFAGAYVRLGDYGRAGRLGDSLSANGVEVIICDLRRERSSASDACWQAHLSGRPYVLLSAGKTPRFHRGLPPSIGMFIDTTQESSLTNMYKGICAAASGYERARNVVVLSDLNAWTVRQHDQAHRQFHRRGSLRFPPNTQRQWRTDRLIESVAEPDWDPLDEVDIADVCAIIQQHGKFTTGMYTAEMFGQRFPTF